MGLLCTRPQIPPEPGFGLEPFGLMPWDSQAQPGPIIGTKLFVLRLSSDYASYPSAGVAEIQFRDYADRVNHVFSTYARLNQIALDGNLTDQSWVFVTDGMLYVSIIVSMNAVSNDAPSSPTKVVLYRLDSIGTDLVGVFTMVGSKTLSLTVGSSDPWIPSTHGYSDGYPIVYCVGRYNSTYSSGDAVTITDWNAYTSTYYPNQTWTADFAITPYLPDLTSVSIGTTETFCARGERYAGSGDAGLVIVSRAHWALDFTGISNASVDGPEISGWSATASFRLAMTGKWIKKMEGATSTPNRHLVYAHPISFSEWCDFAVMWGDYILYENYNAHESLGTATDKTYYVGYAGMTFTDYTRGTYSTAYTLVGMLGSAQAMVFRDSTSGLSYGQFCVVTADDTALAHKYSIFSGVNSDGTISHIEDVEAVTPTLWIDNTQIGTLN